MPPPASCPACWERGGGIPKPLCALKEQRVMMLPSLSVQLPIPIFAFPSSGSTWNCHPMAQVRHSRGSEWLGRTTGHSALFPELAVTGLGLHFPRWTLSCQTAVPKSGLRFCSVSWRGWTWSEPEENREAVTGGCAPPAAWGSTGHCHAPVSPGQAAWASGLTCNPGHGAKVLPGRENFEPCALSWVSRTGQASHALSPESCWLCP